MKRIYVAGAYSANNVLNVLENMRKGMRASTEVFLAGFAPFCPWADYHFQLMLRENENLTLQNFYNYSIAWLEVSDGILVLPGYGKSKGTLNEIRIAEKKGIPIFYSINELKSYSFS